MAGGESPQSTVDGPRQSGVARRVTAVREWLVKKSTVHCRQSVKVAGCMLQVTGGALLRGEWLLRVNGWWEKSMVHSPWSTAEWCCEESDCCEYRLVAKSTVDAEPNVSATEPGTGNAEPSELISPARPGSHRA